MSLNGAPSGYKLLAGLAFALFCGCSAEGGSSGGVGGGGGNSDATGGAGGSGNNMGGAGGNVGEYQPVTVANDGNLYTLQMGHVKMVIDGGVGARITEFSFDGSNVLTAPAVDLSAGHNNYGSTFWPSPQIWRWPPNTALDTLAYTGTVDTTSNSIQLVSGNIALVSNSTGAVYANMILTKKFAVVPAMGAVDVTYTIKNLSPTDPFSVAPWQITRVAGTGGLTFYGKGTDTYTKVKGALTLTDQDNMYWFPFTSSSVDWKTRSDGVGWIAHVTAGKQLLLLKFPDIQATQAATGEGEVELYTGPNGDYVEIEPQGAYTAVAPSGTLEWTVRWTLRQLDSAMAVSVGSAELEAFAQQQLAQ